MSVALPLPAAFATPACSEEQSPVEGADVGLRTRGNADNLECCSGRAAAVGTT
jgi:hypothetical protein